MKLNYRTYQKTQTKSMIKKNKFLLFTIGANQNSANWIIIEQNLHKLNLSYNKIYNNVTTKLFQDSVAKKLKNMINSTVLFLTHKNPNTIMKSIFLNEIGASKLDTVVLKLNKKLYSVPQLKTLNAYHYKKNIAVLQQTLLTTLKSSHRLK